MKITYTDKVSLVTSPLPDENKVTDGNMNEIKQTTNYNDDSLPPIASGYEYFGTTAPNDHYMIADGTAISREDYSELYAIIGTTYGDGDGATTFNLPDLRRRYPLMKGNDDTLGTTGGSEGLYAQVNPIGRWNELSKCRSFIRNKL